MIDTHSHIYAEEFDNDRDEVVQRAKDIGVKHIILPNIDQQSLEPMLELQKKYPNFCHAAIGLHPTSVNSDYKSELAIIKSELERNDYIAIGEIGIDLYWDKTYINEQIDAFQQQIELALKYNLAVIIHVRDSFRETMTALEPYKNKGLTGVFHSFTGTAAEANEILAFGGFLLGINGIVTFKNSGLSETLKHISIDNIILETDSPYLTPVPFRGKRNESAYVNLVCEKLVEVYELEKTAIIEKTSENAYKIFKKLI